MTREQTQILYEGIGQLSLKKRTVWGTYDPVLAALTLVKWSQGAEVTSFLQGEYLSEGDAQTVWDSYGGVPKIIGMVSSAIGYSHKNDDTAPITGDLVLVTSLIGRQSIGVFASNRVFSYDSDGPVWVRPAYCESFYTNKKLA